MNKAPEIKKEMSSSEAAIVIGYQAAARNQPFMDTLKSLYRGCRKKAQEGLEKNENTAAYWSGRADALELLIDNCLDSLNVNLKKYAEK